MNKEELRTKVYMYWLKKDNWADLSELREDIYGSFETNNVEKEIDFLEKELRIYNEASEKYMKASQLISELKLYKETNHV